MMSVRLVNNLKRGGIFTYEDLKEKTQSDIFRIKGMGRRSFRELIDLLIDENQIEQNHLEEAYSFFLKKVESLNVLFPIKERHLFAFNLYKEGKTFREVGEILSVTGERARQIVVECGKMIKKRERGDKNK